MLLLNSKNKKSLNIKGDMSKGDPFVEIFTSLLEDGLPLKGTKMPLGGTKSASTVTYSHLYGLVSFRRGRQTQAFLS